MSLAKVDVDENVEIAMEYLVIKLGYVFIRVIPNKKKKMFVWNCTCRFLDQGGREEFFIFQI